jgi:hypothetical protein
MKLYLLPPSPRRSADSRPQIGGGSTGGHLPPLNRGEACGFVVLFGHIL